VWVVTRPLVSVVVPVYNGERFLTFALQSIFDQDYRPLEVIVVDDGSVDDSVSIARSFQGVRYVYQSNQGASAARNAGVAAAQGELIAFLDADDVWTPNYKISRQTDYLLKHPETGYVVGRGENFLESETDLPAGLTQELFMKEHTFLTSTLVVRKSVFYEVGEFDRSYKISQDTDWFVRASDAGVQSFVLPETLVYRRIHDANLSSQTQVLRHELLRLARESIGRRRKQKAENN
jgi:glycosyltransferase involved in cell wall biosynthesis